MKEIVNIEYLQEELPSEYADRLGIYYTKLVSPKHKKGNEQFSIQGFRFVFQNKSLLHRFCISGLTMFSMSFLVKHNPLHYLVFSLQ